MRTDRVEFLGVRFDCLTFEQVKRRLAKGGDGFRYVVTPNVDHIVRLNSRPELLPIYDQAELCVCDSRVLRLLSRIHGLNLPLVPGSDLTAEIFAHVVEPGDVVAVVGGTKVLLEKLRSLYPSVDFLHHQPPMNLRTNPQARREAAQFIAESQARFAFLAVGSPQQEMIARETGTMAGASGTALCIGASLEFLTGDQKRAPRWVQQLGAEWVHRLLSNPKRLWRRYLVEGMAIVPIFARWSLTGPGPRPTRVFAVSLTAAATLGLYGSAFANRWPAQRATLRSSTPSAAVVGLPPPDLLRPLSPEAAFEKNAQRPFSGREDSPAAPFVLPSDAPERAAATECLAQAVYYEAGSESADGGRAVAQVVLNRVRHPAYPSSVCGVVYEGAERGAGCQFTFACDGALSHRPKGVAWRRAIHIAEKALSGSVFAPVGHSTHYHADYVLPYWADSLDKSVSIGRHIFYRLRGGLGDPAMFRQRYSGVEGTWTDALASATQESTQAQATLEAVVAPGPRSQDPIIASATGSQLLADAIAGVLISDEQLPPREQRKPADTASRCASAGPAKVRSLERNESRAGAGSAGEKDACD
jgi:exopolysaccharide biosynthesis WecB/TagA/CpsF family protein